MKYLVIILYFVCTLFVYPASIQVYATPTYARIMNESYLYKYSNATDNIDDIYCILEKTYFVEIISDSNNTYKVNYNGITGYVKKNDVKLVTNTPNTPYPIGINMTTGYDCNLRSTPSTKSSRNNIITTIYKNESNITFIGRIYAEETIDFGGTTWYYVHYDGYYGYIYNKYISHISPIYANTEKVVYKSDNITHIDNPITHTPSLIIILILLLPCIIILLILYVPRKIKTKNKIKKPKKIIDKY